jgi:hypothetical protein
VTEHGVGASAPFLSGVRFRAHAALGREGGEPCWWAGSTASRSRRCRSRWRRRAREVAEAKVEHSWLKAAPSLILQQTLRDLDRACRRHGTFRVRWKSRQRWQHAGRRRGSSCAGSVTGARTSMRRAPVRLWTPGQRLAFLRVGGSRALFVGMCIRTIARAELGAKNTPVRGHAGHRAWRPRRQPVREAPTSVKPQGINAPTAEVGIPLASGGGGSPSPSAET